MIKQDKTIAAIATGTGGGIGIVRLSGIDAVKITQSVFKGNKELAEMKGFTGTLGKVIDESGVIDEAVVFVYCCPRSYTGEDICEISCHGGQYGLERILSAVLANGATMAEPGEFTKRAFLNGKMTLTQAESVAQIISSQNKQALATAMEVKNGELFSIISGVIMKLTDCAAHISAWIDYPEEDVEEVMFGDIANTIISNRKILSDLVLNFDNGRMIRDGITTAIVGCPNVGKSTLMNCLSGYERSIVTQVAGTTRDVIQETIRLGDVMLNLSDTAGIRNTDDEVEQLGIERSVSRIESSQLVLAVFDGSRPLSDGDISLLQRLDDKLALAIINKADLGDSRISQEVYGYVDEVIEISAKNKTGLDQLSEKIEKMVRLNQVDSKAILLSNRRQLDCTLRGIKLMDEVLECLDFGQTLDAVSVLLEEIMNVLMELTGRNASRETIDQVFQQFCVGK